MHRTLSLRLRHALAGLAALALLPLAPAQAGLFDDEEARKAIIELRGRYEISIRDMTKRLDGLEQRIERVETGLRGQLELQNQIEALRREIAELRGRLEVQTNELARTQLQQREQASTLESKLGGLDARIKKVEPVTVSVTVDERSFNVDEEEKRRFDGALNLLRASDFRGAQNSLSVFMSLYPDSPYTASALYWLGSSQFALKDYRAAIASNERLLARFADHPRAADAALGIAFSQIELGDRAVGRKSLEALIEKYPASDAARQARERLPTLKR